MGSNSIIEMYTTLFGWMMYNRIWDVLNDTGIVYIPFILLFINALRKHKSKGQAIAARGLVASLRIELMLSLFVLLLFVIPVVPLSTGNISSTRVSIECGAAATTVTPGADPSTYASTNAFSTLGGTAVYMPAGWALWQTLTNGISAAAVAGIPCSGDLRGFQISVNDQTISDPTVRREMSDFAQQCYGATVALLQQDNPINPKYPPPLSAGDLAWMGSSALLAHPLYNVPISEPRADWPYDPTRDDGYGNNGMGHPTCNQWWNGAGANTGLRRQLVAQIDPAVLAKAEDASAGGMRAYFGAGATTAQIEDDVLHSVIQVSDRQPLAEGANLNNDYAANTDHSSSGSPDLLTGLVVTLGAATTSVSHFPKMMMIREALPIAKAFLVMTLIMLLPFVLVLSGYNIAVAATAAVALLGLQVYDLLWAVAYWMDNMLVKTLESDVGGFLGWLNHPQTTLAMDFVTSVLCIIMPLLWFAMLGWIGVQTFNFIAQAARDGVSSAGNAGASGASALLGAIDKGARK